MNAFWTLFRRELGTYFISPVAYVVLLVLTLSNGLAFVTWVDVFMERGIKDATVLQAMMSGFVFWFTIMVVTPVITMRLFSEEFKMGTIEMLLTAPVREWEVVLSKYFGALVFFVVLWLPVAVNLGWLHFASSEKINISVGMVTLPFLGLFLFGMFYIAIGLLASVTTRNQIIAAIVSFVLIFGIFFMGLTLPWRISDRKAQDLSAYFSGIDQMDTFCKGIFDTRPVVFYLSGTIFCLFLTQRILQARRLKS